MDNIAETINREKENIKKIFEIRKSIEPQIAMLAAENITDNDIKNLESILEKQKLELEQNSVVLKADAEFHQLIAEIANDSIITQTLKLINKTITQSRAPKLLSEKRKKASIQSHVKIIDALKARKPDAAYDAMLSHLVEIENKLTN